MAIQYREIGDNKKTLEWIELCESKKLNLSYDKTLLEFQTKHQFVGELFTFSEIEQLYFDTLNKAKGFDDFENRKRFLMQEYCNFLFYSNEYNYAISLCKEYFQTYNMDLSEANNCIMLDRYLCAAITLDDQESLKKLTNEAIIQSMYQNENVSIAVAWSFGKLSEIYMKWDDKETADKYLRHMVVLLNKESGFFNNYIKRYYKISDIEFAEYMHSCDELLESLNDALGREDAEALYIEGRYQEKQRNYDKSFVLYGEAAKRDSLRGMCSLALFIIGEKEEIVIMIKLENIGIIFK